MIKCNIGNGKGVVEAKGTEAAVICEWITVLQCLLKSMAAEKNEFDSLKYAALKTIESGVDFDAEGTNVLAIKIPIKKGDK